MKDALALMTPLQLLAAISALLIGYGFLCRLAVVTWDTVQARYVVMHLAGLGYCGAVMFLQPEGAEVVAEFLGLIFCGCWLLVSYPTWRNGPPRHAQTRPAPLDEAPRSRVWSEP